MILKQNPAILSPDLIFVGQSIRLPKNLLYAKYSEDIVQPDTGAVVIEPVAKPMPTTTKSSPKKISSKKASFSTLVLLPKLGYSSIESSKFGSANVVSDLGTGISLQWKQNWREHLVSEVYVDYMKYNFTANSSSTLANSATSYSEFGFGLQRRFWDRTYFSLKFGMRNSPFLRAVSQNVGSLDKIQAGVVKVGLQHQLKKLDSFTLGLLFPIEYSFGGSGANISTEGGLGLGLGLNLQQKLNWGSIKTQFIYIDRSNSFSDATTRFKEIIFSFGLTYDLEGEE